MELVIVRHGRTVENENDIHQGHTDGTLSETGKTDCKKLAKRLKNESFDVIYCSDLGRCRDTLEILQVQDTPTHFVTELRELYTGVGGRPRKEIDWGNLPADSESFDDMKERARKFLSTLKNKHDGERLLLST